MRRASMARGGHWATLSPIMVAAGKFLTTVLALHPGVQFRLERSSLSVDHA
jgi:hypothetical protein